MGHPQPVRVLFYIEGSPAFTGGPQIVVNMVEGLDPRRARALVATGSETRMTEELARLGAPYRVLPIPAGVEHRLGAALRASLLEKLRLVARTLGYGRAVARLLREESIELTWARNLKGVLLVGIATRLAGLPLIWDMGMEKPSRGWTLPMHFLAFLLATRVVAEGPSVYRQAFPAWLRRLFRAKLTVNPPGLPEGKLARLPRAPRRSAAAGLRILCIASITPRKNQAMLLEAMAKVRAPGLSLRLAGSDEDPAYRARLERMVTDADLEGVEFLGWRADAYELLAEADLVVLCSWNEGVPVTVLEAQHAGVPVVVTRAGGMPDVVEDGVTGSVVEPGDVEGLAGVLARFAADPTPFQNWADAARERAREVLVASAWRDRYMDVFEELTR